MAQHGTFRAAFGRLRNFWTYFAVALVAFLLGHFGGGLLAYRRVWDASWSEAWFESTRYAFTPFGLLFLFAPFLGVALLSSHFQKRARLRGIVLAFAAGLATLVYFYVDQHYWAEVSLQNERWTAAALAVGLLPFFIGVPVFLGVAALQAIAAKLDPQV